MRHDKSIAHGFQFVGEKGIVEKEKRFKSVENTANQSQPNSSNHWAQSAVADLDTVTANHRYATKINLFKQDTKPAATGLKNQGKNEIMDEIEKDPIVHPPKKDEKSQCIDDTFHKVTNGQLVERTWVAKQTDDNELFGVDVRALGIQPFHFVEMELDSRVVNETRNIV